MKEFPTHFERNRAIREADRAFSVLMNKKYRMFPNGMIWEDLLERVHTRTYKFMHVSYIQKINEYTFNKVGEPQESIRVKIKNPISNIGINWGILQRDKGFTIATAVTLELKRSGKPNILLQQKSYLNEDVDSPENEVLIVEIGNKKKVPLRISSQEIPLLVTAEEAISRFAILK